MVRPRRISEAIAAAGGALLMLLGGYVGFGEALTLLRSQWNVYGFFLGFDGDFGACRSGWSL